MADVRNLYELWSESYQIYLLKSNFWSNAIKSYDSGKVRECHCLLILSNEDAMWNLLSQSLTLTPEQIWWHLTVDFLVYKHLYNFLLFVCYPDYNLFRDVGLTMLLRLTRKCRNHIIFLPMSLIAGPTDTYKELSLQFVNFWNNNLTEHMKTIGRTLAIRFLYWPLTNKKTGDLLR